jgi:phosphoribosylformylglycinamidine cyclo-ligase
MDRGLAAIKTAVKSTKTPGVLSDIGRFGGLFRSPGKDAILVASTDGVGTKLKVANLAGRHGTVGQDLVNHCVNDILTQGARPLFFLDYLGTDRLHAPVFAEVVKGLCKACRENGCALLGGETAEMPGLYPKGEYDLVGTIVGVVDKKRLVTGETLRRGDVLIGLPSSGLQTNGYSLARKILFEKLGLGVNDPFPGLKKSVADVLLAVHTSFLKPIEAVWAAGVKIHGMAHITGGGLIDNVPRMLPNNLDAVILRETWKVPPYFQLLQKEGHVDPLEMFRVFNMGIGYVLAVRPADLDRALAALRSAKTRPIAIGYLAEGTGKTVL